MEATGPNTIPSTQDARGRLASIKNAAEGRRMQALPLHQGGCLAPLDAGWFQCGCATLGSKGVQGPRSPDAVTVPLPRSSLPLWASSLHITTVPERLI